MGFLEKRGSWFSFEGEQLGQGRDQTKALLASNPELCQKLYDRIMETIKTTPGAGTKVDASE
jgi:recombination protein RecA